MTRYTMVDGDVPCSRAIRIIMGALSLSTNRAREKSVSMHSRPSPNKTKKVNSPASLSPKVAQISSDWVQTLRWV